MIISSAPFRISFAGGGSDIAFFYRRRRGAVLSTSIDKYIYISLHPYFNSRRTLLKYSRNELVSDLAEIRHPVFREVLQELWPEGGLEVVSTADIPSGTGLGSSSSFTVALLHAVYASGGTFCGKEKLAAKACEIEVERLGEPIGKQDQYAAAYGGLNFIEFNPDESVAVTPLILPRETLVRLDNNLLLFYTGEQRSTGEILEDQRKRMEASSEKFDNLSRMADLAYEMRDHLIAGDLEGFARAMSVGWMLKRSLSGRVSDQRIDGYYELALENGASGGKLLGAGGGGFLLFYCEPEKQEKLRKALSDLPDLPFKFDWAGSRIIYVGKSPVKKGFLT